MMVRAALVLALGLTAACGGGGGQKEVDEETPEVSSSSAAVTGDKTPDPDEQASPNVMPITEPNQTMAAGRLSPVNNSGVTGSVNLRGLSERTEVSMNVTGLPAGSQQVAVTVVQGTCEQSGNAVVSVGPLSVGAGNIAAITDTVNVPPGTLMNGQHAIIVKGENAGPATPPLACSPLPKWERLPQTG